MAMFGMFSGVLATGIAADRFRAFYEGTARGAWTLPELAHCSYGAAVGVVTALALLGFRGVAWWERRARERLPREPATRGQAS
jgi:hypothetical protein